MHSIWVQVGENDELREVGNTEEEENSGLKSDKCPQRPSILTHPVLAFLLCAYVALYSENLVPIGP